MNTESNSTPSQLPVWNLAPGNIPWTKPQPNWMDLVVVRATPERPLTDHYEIDHYLGCQPAYIMAKSATNPSAWREWGAYVATMQDVPAFDVFGVHECTGQNVVADLSGMGEKVLIWLLSDAACRSIPGGLLRAKDAIAATKAGSAAQQASLDQIALDAATAICALPTKEFMAGGGAQLKAKIQCLIAEVLATPAPVSASERDAVRDMLQEICDMQAKYYGDGMHTHLALIDLCDKARKILQSQPAAASEQVKVPEPFGYFHELLNDEGKGTGIWLGCPKRSVTEQAYVEGETGRQIVALYNVPVPPVSAPAVASAEQVRDQALEEAAKIVMDGPLIDTGDDAPYFTDACKAMALTVANRIRALRTPASNGNGGAA